MKENRWGKRFKERQRTRFGTEELDIHGFVDDFAVRGIFIKSTTILSPGTEVKVEIDLPSGTALLRGTVQWGKKSRPGLAWRDDHAGMGIRINRFMSGEYHYEQFVQALCMRTARQRKQMI